MPSSSDWIWKPTGEDFDLAGHIFNVDKAKRLITKSPRSVEPIRVEDFAPYLVDEIVRVRAAGSKKYQLDVPVIVGTMKSGRRILLDGWHRLRKAMDTGIAELPAVILTHEETWAIKWKRYPY